MSSEVDTPPAPSDVPPGSDASSGSKDDKDEGKGPLWHKIAVAVASGVAGALIAYFAALKGAEVAGEYQLRNAEKTAELQLSHSETEFLRNQRIAAYGKYVQDLLLLEQKYERAEKFLTEAPLVTTAEEDQSKVQAERAQKAVVLRGELDAAMDAITQSKSVVDVVGSAEVVSAGETAINKYGEQKGNMQYDLDTLTNVSPLPPGEKYKTTRDLLLKDGRQPFTDRARENLKVPAN